MPGSDIFNNFQKEGIAIKETPGSFFTYLYGYQETGSEKSVRLEKELRRWRRRVFRYNFKYIISKKAPFPFGFLLRLFDFRLLSPLSYLLGRAYFKKGFYRYFHLKIIMRLFQDIARYFPVEW